MNRINYRRVLTGGLLAGVVISVGEFVLNELVLGERWLAAMEARGMEPPGTGVMIFYVIMTLILGVALVWLYAAIRPRYGPGPRTAACAGLFVWFLIWLWCFAGTSLWGFFPADLVVISVLWALVEVVVAAIAGGWLYSEVEQAPVREG